MLTDIVVALVVLGIWAKVSAALVELAGRAWINMRLRRAQR